MRTPEEIAEHVAAAEAADALGRASKRARASVAAEDKRRKRLHDALATGKVDEARAHMTDEERARFDARQDAERAAAEQRAAAERAALALAEVQRRAAAGDEEATAILTAKAEADAAEKARREEAVRRERERAAKALEEQHVDVSTADLAALLGVEVPPVQTVELADEDVVSGPTP